VEVEPVEGVTPVNWAVNTARWRGGLGSSISLPVVSAVLRSLAGSNRALVLMQLFDKPAVLFVDGLFVPCEPK
jgi:hypothetical protein